MKSILHVAAGLMLILCLMTSCTDSLSETKSTASSDTGGSSYENRIHSYEKSEENIALIDFSFGKVFKIGMPEDVSDVNARFHRLDDGIVYIVRGEEGHVAGYFDLDKMILSENIIAKKDSLSSESLKIFNTSSANSVSVFDESVFISSLAQGTFQSYEIDESILKTGASFKNVLLRDNSAFIYENEKLIMTALIDFDTQYVLCPKNKLENYGDLMGMAEDENKIYYAMKKEGSEKYTGYAYFEYKDGASSSKADKISKNAVNLEFDEYTHINDSKVLLKNKTNRAYEFTFLDFNTGETSEISISATENIYGYTCDKKGTYLFVYTADSSLMFGGELHIYDMEKDARIKITELGEHKINKNITLDSTDTRLIFSQLSSEGDGEKGELIGFYDVRALWK